MTAKTRFYSGQNGPVACRNRAMADRVADFLSIFQEGAAKCGLEATIDVAKFSESDIPAILAKLRPGQSVRNETATSKAAVNIIGFAKPTMDFTFPVACLPRMAYIAEQIQNAQRQPTADDRIFLRALDEVDTLALLKQYLHQPMRTGGAHLVLTGNVHQRWLTRPFVPFPAELTAEEKDYWHNFQMPAQTDADSYCLVDIEANRMFSGACAVRSSRR